MINPPSVPHGGGGMGGVYFFSAATEGGGLIFKALALWADDFYKSKCLSVCLSVFVFTFKVPFKRLFAPTSQNRMSNIFRDSESLGKSNGKKWSQI